jgi:hypothetical protein
VAVSTAYENIHHHFYTGACTIRQEDLVRTGVRVRGILHAISLNDKLRHLFPH